MSHNNREKGGRVVFIGNIPYGVSEEQICEIFGRAGQVVNFRLVYDKESGKPKGFGFLEYTDVDAAATAVRNLNGFELNSRPLKVDYSNDNDKGNRGGGGGGDFDGGSGRAPPPAHFNMNMTGRSNGAAPPSVLPPLPSGVQLPAGLSAPDAISQTLGQIDSAQLLDILSQMKTLTQNEPARATALLQQSPQLGYAIFQALLMMNLVSPDILSSLIQQSAQAPPAVAPAQPPPMPYGQPPPGFPPQFGAPPPGFGAPPTQYAPTPPQVQAYQPPPAPAAPAAPAGQQDQSQMIQTIMALTRDQIMALDESSKQQILAIRQQMGAPVL